jgi:uncharacterized protein
VVCSTCGYENPVGHRFCGMCGTPLPHPPLTAPGAQSTASLTRPLADNAGLPRSDNPARPADDTEPDTPALEAAPPPHLELVPEIPLDEYVKGFRYVPPDDSEEVTMRGETPVLGPEPPEPSNAASATPAETASATTEGAAPASADDVRDRLGLGVNDTEERSDRPRFLDFNEPPTLVETATAATEAAAPASADDVEERLGLEVNDTAEERSDRPRFLDFNEPPAPHKPAPAVVVTPIYGSSFLGLGETPQVDAATDDELEVKEPTRWKWRIGVAAVVVLVFGYLGVLEWQAQVRQTNDGPVEVAKTKLRSMGYLRPAEDPSAVEAISTKMWNLAHNKWTERASLVEAIKTKMRSLAYGQATDNASSESESPGTKPKPQKKNPSATDATSTQAQDAATVPDSDAATTPPAGSEPVTPGSTGNEPVAGQSAATAVQNSAQDAAGTPAGQNTAAAKPLTTAPNADKSKSIGSPQAGSAVALTAGKAKPSPQAADDGGGAVARKMMPGAEEVTKANNASDSAAEAAWLWKATAKGNPTAPVRLADMYVKGAGVPRSCEQAMVLLKSAAQKENAVARNRLAFMYSSGICVQRNRLEAYRWLSSALVADPHSEWAQQNRELLWRQMTPEERTLAEKYK